MSDFFYNVQCFFYDVQCFFKNFPAVVLTCLAYLMGARPYRVMVNFKNDPLFTPPHYFAPKLLPMYVDPNSPATLEKIAKEFDLFNVNGMFIFKRLDPMPFWSYLWNDVWMDIL